jgi:hypothetical protein
MHIAQDRALAIVIQVLDYGTMLRANNWTICHGNHPGFTFHAAGDLSLIHI